jgi:heme exporter protein CcmD
MTLREFMDMSGYGAYVWSCYALTFAVLIWLGVGARREFAAELVRAKRRAQAAVANTAQEGV